MQAHGVVVCDMMVVVVEKQTKVKHSDRHFCKAKPPLPFPPTLEV